MTQRKDTPPRPLDDRTRSALARALAALLAERAEARARQARQREVG